LRFRKLSFFTKNGDWKSELLFIFHLFTEFLIPGPLIGNSAVMICRQFCVGCLGMCDEEEKICEWLPGQVVAAQYLTRSPDFAAAWLGAVFGCAGLRLRWAREF
jgi:hypothetical protein